MSRQIKRVAVVILGGVVLLTSITSAWTQDSYTFTSGIPGDGFDWPVSPPGLLPDEAFNTPDNFWFANATFNNMFFDQQYQAAGNTIGISADACWGNPKPDTSPDQWPSAFAIDFVENPLQTLQFNFAWTSTLGIVGIYIEDTDSDGENLAVTLPGVFDTGPVFGHRLGHEAFIFLDSDALGLDNIGYIEIDLDPIATLGGSEEFAIDNLAWNQTPPPPNTSQLYPGSPPGWTIGIGGESILPSPLGNTYTTTAHVRNYTNDPIDATDDTTYSVIITGPFTDPGGQTHVPIAAGELIQNGIQAAFDLTQPSGEYLGEAILRNDLNLNDPDNVITLGYSLWDQVDISNNNDLLDPRWGEELWITNAAAGPHEGALRASARITEIEILDAPISVIGFDVGTIIDPAETVTATVNTRGLINGSYAPRVMVHMQMCKPDGDDIPFANIYWVPPAGWNFWFTVGDQTTGNWNCNTGENFSDLAAGVNNTTTAATIIDGVSSSDQTISMTFVENPEEGGDISVPILGEVLDLEFSGGDPVDLYVLQFTYRDQDLPVGFEETDLKIYSYDPVAEKWIEAVLANSDHGTGAELFLSSYDAYLVSIGGGSPELSAFGVDVTSNQLWAVLNHASLFGAGTKTGPSDLTADFNHDGVVDNADYATWLDGFGMTTGAAQDNGDADADGDVDGSDFLTWQREFGRTSGNSASPVPEPASFFLLLLLIVGGLTNARIHKGFWP